jgi:[ribosomal protein S5]-alanine N-acetyltransferase
VAAGLLPTEAVLMEKMPHQPGDAPVVSSLPTAIVPGRDPEDWRLGLPTLTGSMVTLREVSTSDAHALHAALTTSDVSHFVSPLPPTVDGFERFISVAQRRREAGEYACFAVVPRNSELAVGRFQIRSLEPGFKTAEWEFALAVEYWGTGVFLDAARLTLDFVFAAIGAHRLEARVAVENDRGNRALRKIGAVRECELRGSFLRNGEYVDQRLWTILVEEWHEGATLTGVRVIH